MLRAFATDLSAKTPLLARGINWPARPNPSPYDIFGISPETFDKKELPKIYKELAKRYHPDRHSASHQAGERERLTLKERNQRFKAIGAAYQTLKDESRRRSWDLQHGLGSRGVYSTRVQFHPGMRPHAPWNGGDSHAGPPPPGYFYTGGPKYWSGETDNMEYTQRNFDEELKENRMILVRVVLAVMAVTGAIELYGLTNASGSQAKRLEEVHQRTEAMNQLAYANYGYGDSPADRVERFKAQREGHLAIRGKAFGFNDLTQDK